MVGAVEQAADRGVGAQAVKALGADEDKRENDGANATDAARSPPPRPATALPTTATVCTTGHAHPGRVHPQATPTLQPARTCSSGFVERAVRRSFVALAVAATVNRSGAVRVPAGASCVACQPEVVESP
jgi:hypothetical protein